MTILVLILIPMPVLISLNLRLFPSTSQNACCPIPIRAIKFAPSQQTLSNGFQHHFLGLLMCIFLFKCRIWSHSKHNGKGFLNKRLICSKNNNPTSQKDYCILWSFILTCNIGFKFVSIFIQAISFMLLSKTTFSRCCLKLTITLAARATALTLPKIICAINEKVG